MLHSAEEVQRSEKTRNEVQAGVVARKSETEPRRDKTFISLKDLYRYTKRDIDPTVFVQLRKSVYESILSDAC